ncbi:hypothetical protein PPYR_14588 [Photinus pyralis]|uniref:G patch domain-containing protein n=2 Tax=Photinus pyralis TaxID=7054 RepID=A0A5N4A5T7_PHOPY|nr:G patch domain-containing protein 1 homolog [Photinus pyralis]KAB0792629.1 hypothetical protein PPYR_14588 [Photinus pyralis]
MSDSEEEVCYYGKPLEPYDEDSFPKKRPISVEEQVAKDAQGRRRFHGAFTGGFSAGFYNTVGSLEGWAPAEFRSSRSEKAESRVQRPSDFMDDEDIGEFGIAPQAVKATDEYAKTKKRKKQIFSDGPIPGEPVLDTLLQAGNETVGYFLMRNINRKNRGVDDKSGPKVYGCAMPKDIEDEPSPVENDLHRVYTEYLSKPKINTYGLGYFGLNKTHVNLFQPAKLTVRERNNKKLSIAGQAFGVGAFEDEDEDIYVKDDMSHYDFELTAETSKEKVAQSENLVFGVFVVAKTASSPVQNFPPPVIPGSFSGRHNIKKSRFEPVLEEPKAPERKEMDATIRAKYLGENSAKSHTPSAPVVGQTKPKPVEEKQPVKTVDSSLIFDRFVSAKQEDDVTNMLEPVKPTETTHGTSEMHAAVKLKMFGPLTRVTLTWQPNGLLCKRFNVPEPKLEVTETNKKRTKNLIFEYQKQVDREVDHKPGLSVQNVIETKPEIAPTLEVEVQAENVIPPTPEVQKPIDETERVDVSKNADLFKAVFLSSGESESEGEERDDEKEKERNEQLTASVVSEPLVPKIRPIKEGILSNIQFKKREPVENKSRVPEANPDMYGPQLPVTKVSVQNNIMSVTHSDDEWVEKDEVGKEKKHKKKHKKEKHRKKHKDKSKK